MLCSWDLYHLYIMYTLSFLLAEVQVDATAEKVALPAPAKAVRKHPVYGKTMLFQSICSILAIIPLRCYEDAGEAPDYGVTVMTGLFSSPVSSGTSLIVHSRGKKSYSRREAKRTGQRQTPGARVRTRVQCTLSRPRSRSAKPSSPLSGCAGDSTSLWPLSASRRARRRQSQRSCRERSSWSGCTRHSQWGWVQH